MAISDADQCRFLLYAGGMFDLPEALQGADSEAALAAHIAQWEASKRRGDSDAAVTSQPAPDQPRPTLGCAARPGD